MTRRDEHRAGEPQRGELGGRGPCGKACAEPVEQAALAAREDILLNADRRLGDGFELAHVDPLLPAVTKVPAACHLAVIEAKSFGRKSDAIGAACTRASQPRQTAG